MVREYGQRVPGESRDHRGGLYLRPAFEVARSARVHLREVRLSDWRAVYAYASNPRVVEFQAWGPHSEQDSKDWVRLAIDEQGKTPRGMSYWAVAALVTTVFTTTDLFRLTAHCRDTHSPSIRLLEALRFRREGHFLQDTWLRGKRMSSFWYALLKNDHVQNLFEME